jgi:O-antigen/teichoic acid export membrane protein
MIVAIAAIARLSLDVALVLNLVSLVVTAILILWVAARDDTLGFRPSARLLAEELRFGTRSLPGSLAERLQFRGDAFLINIILGEAYTAACMFNGYLAGRERVAATSKFVEARNRLNELGGFIDQIMEGDIKSM